MNINLILEQILLQCTMAEFKHSLSYETLDPVFECDDINLLTPEFSGHSAI